MILHTVQKSTCISECVNRRMQSILSIVFMCQVKQHWCDRMRAQLREGELPKFGRTSSAINKVMLILLVLASVGRVCVCAVHARLTHVPIYYSINLHFWSFNIRFQLIWCGIFVVTRKGITEKRWHFKQWNRRLLRFARKRDQRMSLSNVQNAFLSECVIVIEP